MDGRFVYDFEEGSSSMSALLGGKGANLAGMTGLLGPDRVPPGFTVTTEACRAFLDDGSWPEGLREQVSAAIARLEAKAGRRLGDPGDPLLVSVRSGGRVSMPGMMDTVLDLGLDEGSTDGLAAASGDERFAWDSYARFCQMFATVVRGIPGDAIADGIESPDSRRDAPTGSKPDVGRSRDVVHRCKELVARAGEPPIPDDPWEQLDEAMEAVFRSWNGDRAVRYRRIHGIPDSWCTAVNVQAMVFGNRGPDSGSGVAFSRDSVTGAPGPSGDWLPDAQGEDVVSGSRDTLPLDDLASRLPGAWTELTGALSVLERHFRDMQDIEFTLEQGRLWILQARTAKRPAQASVRFACDAVDEELLGIDAALLTVDATGLEALLHPALSRPIRDSEILARGVGASPGAARGKIVFSAAEAIAAAGEGTDTILVRRRTEAEDIGGFNAANGILTTTGGKASHAALVARGMGKPCVCGAAGISVDPDAGLLRFADGSLLGRGDVITIDGSNGLVTKVEVPLIEPELDPHLERVLDWADSRRTLGVRANADNPLDARRALTLGAEGIGLCRTEHMFLGAGRVELLRRTILARDEAERSGPLEALLAIQQRDFENLFETMDGRPITVRLLDPPLHEFLRTPAELEAALASAAAEGRTALAAEIELELESTLRLQEENPMLGIRGARLGLLHPDIYAMQVRAACRAARAVAERTSATARLSLMLPLIAFGAEMAICRESITRTLAEEGLAEPERPPIGSMIELPRACLTADSIAAEADFLSFGTNDLTQTTLGLSRDDVEASLLGPYAEMGILERSPFQTLDVEGVGQLVRSAVDLARMAKPGSEIGICGEHGGDPESIGFFAECELDYVSCSPFRIPTARLAAAQQRIRTRQKGRRSNGCT